MRFRFEYYFYNDMVFFGIGDPLTGGNLLESEKKRNFIFMEDIFGFCCFAHSISCDSTPCFTPKD